MTGRHARKPPMPFWVLIAALVLAVGFVVVTLSGSGSGSPSAGGSDGSDASSTRPSSPTLAASPTAPTSTPEPKGTLVIHGAGDVSLDPSYISTYASQGYGYAWSGLGRLFRHDDLTIVNVECPVTDRGSQLVKEFSFHGTPAALPAMRDAGVDVGSLANNHAYDRGPDGVVDSRRNLAKAGIAPVGAGVDQSEALRPARFEIKGWRIAVLGFDEVLDPLDEVAGPDKPGTAAGHDFSLMVQAVRAAAVDADVVVVMIHWGVELDTLPRDYQIAEGHRLIDAGADAIFGAHSHRLQPMSVYHGRPIFWSLGNFVWPNFSTSGSTTAVAQVTISPNGRFVGKLLPAFITAPGHPELR
jgi:poly-gamma-glutamate capsule biosynthesis protein CapA/YwtB (metallophosphatase superfamily)